MDLLMLPVLALVGRPNVGKSTLFNRLTRTRNAIVAEFPGLTRDRQYGRGVLGDFDYLVVDTGGLSGDESGIDGSMAEQARHAIGEADLVLFIVDIKDGVTPGDEAIAELLRTGDRRVVLVANKVDGQNPDLVDGEFAGLGFGSASLISATHGQGVPQMLSYLAESGLVDRSESDDVLPATLPGHHDDSIRIAMVGRPNVGKSTLVNRILGEERVVVFDEAGTTRDSIYVPFEREGQRYTLIDTAGVRKRGRVKQTIEKFSVVKTLNAINDAHVVILMMDAREGVVEQDLHLLGHVVEAGRALIVAVNKWDGLSPDERNEIKVQLERRLTFLDYADIYFISALHGSGVGSLYEAIQRAFEAATRVLKTNQLNMILESAVKEHQPPLVHGRRIKLRYAHVGGHNPPIIVIHGNQTDSVPEAYRRYLTRRFREALNLKGTPVRVEFRTTDNPYKGQKNKLTDRQANRRRRLISHVKKQKKNMKRKRHRT